MRSGIRWRWKTAGDRCVDDATMRRRIAELAAILDGIRWVLGGGLAVPMTLGSFARYHDDIDLLFDDAQFPAIERAFAGAGFALWQRFPMTLFGAFPGALELRVRQDGLLPRLRRRKLQFHPSRPRGAEALQVVDALPFRIVDGVLCTCDRRQRVPLTVPIVGHVARTPQGHAVPCLHLTYVALLKGGRREPKDLLDYARIKDVGLLPAGDWGIG
jgi:hypothetical protein